MTDQIHTQIYLLSDGQGYLWGRDPVGSEPTAVIVRLEQPPVLGQHRHRRKWWHWRFWWARRPW